MSQRSGPIPGFPGIGFWGGGGTGRWALWARTLRPCERRRTTNVSHPGKRVLVIEDQQDVVDLVESLGGKIEGLVFVVELEFLPGRKKLAGYDVRSLIKYQS